MTGLTGTGGKFNPTKKKKKSVKNVRHDGMKNIEPQKNKSQHFLATVLGARGGGLAGGSRVAQKCNLTSVFCDPNRTTKSGSQSKQKFLIKIHGCGYEGSFVRK